MTDLHPEAQAWLDEQDYPRRYQKLENAPIHIFLELSGIIMTPPKHILKPDGTTYCAKTSPEPPFATIEEAFIYNRTSSPCKNCVRRIVNLLQSTIHPVLQ